MVLSRDEGGAEQIFRNDGVKLIQKLLQLKQEDVVLSALRTLVGLCTGHQSRVSVIIIPQAVNSVTFRATGLLLPSNFLVFKCHICFLLNQLESMSKCWCMLIPAHSINLLEIHIFRYL